MLRYILFLTVLGFYKCERSNKIKHTENDTVLFRSSEQNLVFRLEINNDFKYNDSLLNRDVVLGYPIGTYKKKRDSSVIRLRINEKDTVFKYPLYEVDSILFGLTQNRNFYIVTNRDKNAWIID